MEAITNLRHPNLVRLLGYCIDYQASSETTEQVIVYEFINNGDLKKAMESSELECERVSERVSERERGGGGSERESERERESE